jgi:erythromycin esterase
MATRKRITPLTRRIWLLACAPTLGACVVACSAHGEGATIGDSALSADAATDSAPADGGATAPAPLPPGIYALDGTDPTAPADDLAPLLQIIGPATDVGLGESIHTSGGFEAMKARLVRYLVEKAGFRVLAMETPRSAAFDVTDAYVRTCQGTSTDAARGIFPVFACDSTAQLLAWMCAYDQTNPSDPVQFFGFDEQQPWTDYHELGLYLSQAAPADAAALTGGLQTCDGPQATSEYDYRKNHSKDPYSQANFDVCTRGLDALDAYLSQNQAAVTQRTSTREFALAHVASVSLRAWQGQRFYENTDFQRSAQTRDLAMAVIYEALRSIYFPNAKAVLWAHDAHLMRDGNAAGYVENMGSVLSHDFGDAYVPIGLSGWDVEVNWPGAYAKGPTTPLAKSSQVFEWDLDQLGYPWLLVDLTAPGLASFLTPGASYQYGNANNIADLVPAAQFRATIFFQSSPPMNALFW